MKKIVLIVVLLIGVISVSFSQSSPEAVLAQANRYLGKPMPKNLNNDVLFIKRNSAPVNIEFFIFQGEDIVQAIMYTHSAEDFDTVWLSYERWSNLRFLVGEWQIVKKTENFTHYFNGKNYVIVANEIEEATEDNMFDFSVLIRRID